MSAFWSGKKVVVTGGGGFIGGHLVERLIALGADVTAFVRYSASGSRGLLEQLPPQELERVTIKRGDLCEYESAEHAVDGADIVFHLAAIIAIPYSYVHPAEVVRNNIESTMNLLQAARRAKIQRFVHTSSSEVYGTAQRVPIDESHPIEAQSPYAAGKIASDKIVQSWHLAFDIPAVTLRPFNTYGPRQSARAIIPTIIAQALTQKTVFLGAMHPTRDFNFVDDTVDGFIRIAETAGIEGHTYHVGSGREISIGELADSIIRLTGSEAKVIFDATRIRPTASEVNRLICDPARAKADLGWEPRTDLETGLRATIEWVSRNLAAYRPKEFTL